MRLRRPALFRVRRERRWSTGRADESGRDETGRGKHRARSKAEIGAGFLRLGQATRGGRRTQKTIDPEVVLIGDSITHMWGGEPKSNVVNGAKAWAETFGKLKVLNMGFGWDRTQNVLWRLDNGEFEGISPKWVVICIGTNNLTGTKNARENTPAEIVAGVTAIVDVVRKRAPQANIVVMGVLPRGEKADNPFRAKIAAINAGLAAAVETQGKTDAKLRFLDIGKQLLEADGTLPKSVMKDGVHPGEAGYAVWGKALVEAGVGK
ncbi:MAG: GDSL-type esterase/lipase family protein [Pirellulales bacterium]